MKPIDVKSHIMTLVKKLMIKIQNLRLAILLEYQNVKMFLQKVTLQIGQNFCHGSSPSPSNFKGDLKIPDQNNWGKPEQKIKFMGGGGEGVELNFMGAYETQ